MLVAGAARAAAEQASAQARAQLPPARAACGERDSRSDARAGKAKVETHLSSLSLAGGGARRDARAAAEFASVQLVWRPAVSPAVPARAVLEAGWPLSRARPSDAAAARDRRTRAPCTPRPRAPWWRAKTTRCGRGAPSHRLGAPR